MPRPPLISIVVPCYNPDERLREALQSADGQTWQHREIVLVDDGSDQPAAIQLLERAAGFVSTPLRFVRQPNRGLAAARNAGFAAAEGELVVPLDADDALEPEALAVSQEALERQPSAGYAYGDYWRLEENSRQLQQPGPYNLYRLLDQNYLTYCGCYRRSAWQSVGGYDEELRHGYEDWSFHIRLGKAGLPGLYLQQPFFRYRVSAGGLYQSARERDDEIRSRIRELHSDVYSAEGRLAVKRTWAPSLAVVSPPGGLPNLENQTLRDFQTIEASTEAEALSVASAERFLWVAGAPQLRPQALEQCLWALEEADWVSWADTGTAPPSSLRQFAGPLGVSRRAMEWPEPKPSGAVWRLPWKAVAGNAKTAAEPSTPARVPEAAPAILPSPLGRIETHLRNAELLSLEQWLRRPLQSAARLIPLRAKEWVNRRAGRTIFDLSFYLRFQPRSVMVDGELIEPLDYLPRAPRPGVRRIGVMTTHLGEGGAEAVLLEAVRQIDRQKAEILLFAVDSSSSRWASRWEAAVDWIVDVKKLTPATKLRRLLFSAALTWRLDLLIVQNSPAAYSILPALKSKRPELKTIDLLHAVGEDWDFFSATLDVSHALDRRAPISEQGRQRLLDLATPPDKVRLVRNGVDLGRFDPTRYDRAALRRELRIPTEAAAIAFIGRLDPVKQPLLLVEIARELERLAPDQPFLFLVAGGGPEEEKLRTQVARRKLRGRFRLLGHVEDPGETLAAADLLVLTSRGEGVPLVLLEAAAMEKPAVALRAGAVEEALPPECGRLVEPGPYQETRLAQALLELIRDEPARRAMGAAARALVRRQHSLDQMRSSYRELFRELLDG